MSTYPLPGERVTCTLTGVEFGMGRPRDEPAPPALVELFRAEQATHGLIAGHRATWELHRTHAAHEAYIRALDKWERRYNDLLRAMGRHRDHCYTCDGYRFWLYVEPDGCRRQSVRIEEV